jgi:hypothetical protein
VVVEELFLPDSKEEEVDFLTTRNKYVVEGDNPTTVVSNNGRCDDADEERVIDSHSSTLVESERLTDQIECQPSFLHTPEPSHFATPTRGAIPERPSWQSSSDCMCSSSKDESSRMLSPSLFSGFSLNVALVSSGELKSWWRSEVASRD